MNLVAIMERFGWTHQELCACPIPAFMELTKALEDIERENKKNMPKPKR